MTDHVIMTHFLDDLTQVTGFDQTSTDELNQIGMIVGLFENFFDVRFPKLPLFDEPDRLVVLQARQINRRHEAVQKRRGVGNGGVFQYTEPLRCSKNGVDIITALEESPKFWQGFGIVFFNIDEFFRFIAKEHQIESRVFGLAF